MSALRTAPPARTSSRPAIRPQPRSGLRAGYTLLQFRCPAPCAGGYSPERTHRVTSHWCPTTHPHDPASTGCCWEPKAGPALRALAPHAKPGEPLAAARRASAVPLGPAPERRNSAAGRTGSARRRLPASAREVGRRAGFGSTCDGGATGGGGAAGLGGAMGRRWSGGTRRRHERVRRGEGRPASRASALHAEPGEPLGAARRDSAVPFGPALERRDSTAARTVSARRLLASAREGRPALREPPLQRAFWPSPWRSPSWRLVCVPEIWRPGPSWQAPWRSPSWRLACVPEIWRPWPSWQASWRGALRRSPLGRLLRGRFLRRLFCCSDFLLSLHRFLRLLRHDRPPDR